ncbi:MAG: PqqD family peptide modification chaperone [Cyanobacteria bacterium SZAS-4]|nr:PqqD family peptide modification chaperone [Cyanobacteria bacterium SZAS-4]
MIDVVIVAKNEQRHLGAVLSALSAQKHLQEPINVIVVDNGSTDNTAAIATANGATLLHCSGSLGKARNVGIASGTRDLVAFLDAHSVPSPNWATSMSNAFKNHDDLGAVMGSIENISERPGTRMFAKNSIFSSPERLWRSTISGLDSPLPWIPTGNCMYRRSALDAAGGFDESLFRCEDTDLSWKVVLKGYQLLYLPDASVKHYDNAGATSYLRKYYHYGAGAAELAQLYGMKPRTERNETLRGTKMLLDACYRLGRRTATARRIVSKRKSSVDEKFRRPFSWSAQTNLAISSKVVYWLPNENSCICVELDRDVRLVLEDTSALIFKLIAERNGRDLVIEHVCHEYEICTDEATGDVDDFVQHLLNEFILVASHEATAESVQSTDSLKEHGRV